MSSTHSTTIDSTVQPHDLVNKKYCQKSEIDVEKLSIALTRLVRILRDDPTVTVTVTRPAGGAQ